MSGGGNDRNQKLMLAATNTLGGIFITFIGYSRMQSAPEGFQILYGVHMVGGFVILVSGIALFLMMRRGDFPVEKARALAMSAFAVEGLLIAIAALTRLPIPSASFGRIS